MQYCCPYILRRRPLRPIGVNHSIGPSDWNRSHNRPSNAASPVARALSNDTDVPSRKRFKALKFGCRSISPTQKSACRPNTWVVKVCSFIAKPDARRTNHEKNNSSSWGLVRYSHGWLGVLNLLTMARTIRGHYGLGLATRTVGHKRSFAFSPDRAPKWLFQLENCRMIYFCTSPLADFWKTKHHDCNLAHCRPSGYRVPDW